MTDRDVRNERNHRGYDVIGDVHGHADALVDLLAKMGYRETNGAWRHPERQAIFVGDLIDRGPEQLESVSIARAMVEAGSAQMVLGNHEFNAIAYATPDGRGDYLRRHSEKNHAQHAEFVDAVGFDSALHREIIQWFMTLPLWLDLGGLRVVHACWSNEHIEHLRPLVGEHDTLTDELVVTASTHGHPSFDAIETILKGPEISLGGLRYSDKDGNVRRRARLAWWDESATTLPEAVLMPSGATIFDPDGAAASLTEDPIAIGDSPRYDADVPVVFGHYWWSADRGITSDRALCVDFSVAKGGDLVAYRWDGETSLSASKIVSHRYETSAWSRR